MHLICTVRKASEREALLEEFKGKNFHVEMLEVSNEQEIIAFANKIGDEKKVIGLINNAGISRSPTIDGLSKDYETVFGANVKGLLFLTQYIYPKLQRTKGRIINVGSMAGLYGRPKATLYSASKAAVELISDSLRMELKPSGVSVSLIEPGFVASNMCNVARCKDERHLVSDVGGCNNLSVLLTPLQCEGFHARAVRSAPKDEVRQKERKKH